MAKPKKKAAGRPQVYADRVKWTVFLSPELAAAADAYRTAEERSQSWLVGRALAEYLERHAAAR